MKQINKEKFEEMREKLSDEVPERVHRNLQQHQSFKPANLQGMRKAISG